MSDLHYELTGETIEFEGHTLHRIRATRYLRRYHVQKGDLGGWIDKTSRLTDEGWILNEGKVFNHSVIADFGIVKDCAVVKGNSHVMERGVVSENAVVSNYSGVIHDAAVFGHSVVTDSSVVRGRSIVGGVAVLNDAETSNGSHIRAGKFKSVAIPEGRFVNSNINVTRDDHILSMTNIGSEMQKLILVRTNDDIGHTLSVGCWENGIIDRLMDEVHRRSENWLLYPSLTSAIIEEYQAIIPILELRVARWGFRVGG